jgi:hypothetical protein
MVSQAEKNVWSELLTSELVRANGVNHIQRIYSTIEQFRSVFANVHGQNRDA